MIEKRYDPREVEAGKYDFWLKGGWFKAGDPRKPPFSMVIPPPNVTGRLHLGHALDSTPQDIAARYKKLKGFDVLWLPGVDHAGIATQARVEAELRKAGVLRQDLGREKFLEKVWAWKREHAEDIRKQWARMGLMLDYSRERFTLDEGFQAAVRKVFKSLYDEGLIYRGERIIHYDPVLKTALSDIEVVYEDLPGKFYYFRYPIVGTKDFLRVATTRPETMFGDVAVFVNPKDERYQDLVGKEVVNPADGRKLPVMADDYVDVSFGTGAMKCTPAHDPNDFRLSEKYGLAKIRCLDESARMTEAAGPYQGMDRFACREALVKKIEADGLLEKIEDIVHSVGLSERSRTLVEPMLSKQWFVRMGPLAARALRESKVVFLPRRFEKVFRRWMENVGDWCVSRQLWWGHRIPAYHNRKTGEIVVSEKRIDDPDYVEDEDVLDTWFSSALWPFVTLGWPRKTKDYERYFPLSLMSTGYDIIFFWVARMIFQSLAFTGKSPFRVCLIHGLIRDEQGRKMSKSLGNGVDPNDVIDRYGADALRYFLTTCCTPGQDTRYSEAKVEASRSYLNKVWNSARYVLSVLPEDFVPITIDYRKLEPLEQDILKKLSATIAKVTKEMDAYEYSLACQALYDFVYDDFCGRYLEFSKVTLKMAGKDYLDSVRTVLLTILRAVIIMLHPFVPFISEEIYQSLPGHLESIMLESYPVPGRWPKKDLVQVEELIEMIADIRAYKVDNKLPPAYPVRISIATEDALFPRFLDCLRRFSFASRIDLAPSEAGVKYVYPRLVMRLLAPTAEKNGETKKEKDAAWLEAEIARCEGLLSNKGFVEKAPKEKVERERRRLVELRKKLAAL